MDLSCAEQDYLVTFGFLPSDCLQQLFVHLVTAKGKGLHPNFAQNVAEGVVVVQNVDSSESYGRQ